MKRPRRGGARAAAAIAAVAVAVAVSSGCGAGARPQRVASVQGRAISAAEVEHWSRIKDAESRSTSAARVADARDPRQRALAFLITGVWLENEAAAHGITASAADVTSTYDGLLRGPAAAGLGNRMRLLGLTPADEMFQLRLEQLSLRLRAFVMGPRLRLPQARRLRFLDAFVASFRERWRRVTLCSPGYVIAECSNGPPLGAAG